MNQPLICLMGPTASGKSSLALSLTQHWPIEIISMDSAQVYRGMDIGTAKPDAQEQAVCPHHLLDIRDPAQAYSAAEFARDAARIAQQVQARGHLPVIVGGTFLYLRALLQGLHDMPPANASLRQQLEQRAARQGWPALHAELAQADPQAAGKIHPNDAQRIQRALELTLGTDKSRSDYWQQPRQPLWSGPVLKLALLPADREKLRSDIALRFEQMMAQGFEAEVRSLYQRGDLHPEMPSMRSVGYRQLWQHLSGELTRPQAVERGIIATRQYAKRQMTWLRRESALRVLQGDAQARQQQAVGHIRAFLADDTA